MELRTKLDWALALALGRLLYRWHAKSADIVPEYALTTHESLCCPYRSAPAKGSILTISLLPSFHIHIHLYFGRHFRIALNTQNGGTEVDGRTAQARESGIKVRHIMVDKQERMRCSGATLFRGFAVRCFHLAELIFDSSLQPHNTQATSRNDSCVHDGNTKAHGHYRNSLFRLQIRRGSALRRDR